MHHWRMAKHHTSLLIFGVLNVLTACTRFQPMVATQPVPYQKGTPFQVLPEIVDRPDLDTRNHNIKPLAEPYTPQQIEKVPPTLRACVLSRAPVALRPYQVTVAQTPTVQDTFAIKFSLIFVEPGYQGPSGKKASATANAPGVQGSGSMFSAYTFMQGEADVLLEILGPQGDIVDQVRLFGRRRPAAKESMDTLSKQLCEVVLSEARQYIAWRLEGNGK